MNEKILKEAYDTIKKIGFENFCISLRINGPPCVIWDKIAGRSCVYCDTNREKIIKELDAKFRKEKLEKLLS